MFKIGITVAVLAAVGWFAYDYARVKSDYSNVVTQLDQTQKVLKIVSESSQKRATRAVELEKTLEELSDVIDDENCSSPALDRAFDLLRPPASETP